MVAKRNVMHRIKRRFITLPYLFQKVVLMRKIAVFLKIKAYIPLIGIIRSVTKQLIREKNV